jgi:hypothetical protein
MPSASTRSDAISTAAGKEFSASGSFARSISAASTSSMAFWMLDKLAPCSKAASAERMSAARYAAIDRASPEAEAERARCARMGSMVCTWIVCAAGVRKLYDHASRMLDARSMGSGGRAGTALVPFSASAGAPPTVAALNRW